MTRDKKEYDRQYHAAHKEEIHERQRRYCRDHPRKRRDYLEQWRINIKIEVLARYGKGGKVKCCWPKCRVVDLDMLTLDHINNNGASHRKALKAQGAAFRRKIKLLGFPPGFQTLCWNHQWKKEILRRRALGRTPVEFILL